MFSKTWKPLGALAVGLALSLVVAAAEGDKPKDKEEQKETKAQTTCPVRGGQINRAIFADYNGKRVYFCCNGCPATFAKDPAKYVKKLEDAGVTLEAAPKAQTACPVMGGKIDKAVFADYDGKRIYFCCKGCPPEFVKDPAKYVKKLEDDGVTLEKAPAKAGPGAADGAHQGQDHGAAGSAGGGCCR